MQEVKMGYADIISQKVQQLSVEKQAEVLDFVEFIALRSAGRMDWSDQDFSEMSLEQALRVVAH
jgi:hypothetical protein